MSGFKDAMVDGSDDVASSFAASIDDTKRIAETSKLRDALIADKMPVFAVVDGAKFADLPNALLRARLVNRPLYSDRGGQVRDFDLTSPQMVYLDRTRDSPSVSRDRPCEPKILDGLLDFTDDCSSVVFWSCRQGGEVLFRHLRKINRVQVEAGHLPSNRKSAAEKHKDDILLFRHADANVMAQVLPMLPDGLMARLLGPANAIRFVPDIVWSLKEEYEFLADGSASGAPSAGMLRFDGAVMSAIEGRRAVGVLRHLLVTFASHEERMGLDYKTTVKAAYQRAVGYGLESLEDFEIFVQTECEYGPQFETLPRQAEAYHMLVDSEMSSAQRVYYARRACLDAAGVSTSRDLSR